MTETARLMETVSLRWDARLAEQVVREVVQRFWATPGSGADSAASLVEQMRRLLKGRLAQGAAPAEQIRVMEISYRFERAIANHRGALSLAKNLRHLSERKADPLHQVTSAALLSQAWYGVSELSLAREWSRRALQAARPLESKGQGGRPLRMAFATEELRLAWLLALQGGAGEAVNRLLTDALNRSSVLSPATGPAAVLAAESRIRMLEGRWTEAMDCTRRCLALPGQDPAPRSLRTALWAGARAAARTNDPPAAREWSDRAVEASRAAADIPALIAALLSRAGAAWVAGEDDALATADAAVALADLWKVELLHAWATLERSWIRLAAGQGDRPQMQAAAGSLARIGVAPLEAEAHYALYHELRKAGQGADAEYTQALVQFERLKMSWHAQQAQMRAVLLQRV